MRQGITFLLVCCWIVVGSGEVHGSGLAAISLRIDPSIRSHGMGGASSAAFWGGDPNYWANPALLGYHSGFRYEYGKTQLVPDLANDVFFTSTRYSAGAWGVGFAFGGKPGRLGGSHLDYGRSDIVDINGNVVGSFDSFENVEMWGVGANVVEVTENIVSLFSSRPTWSQYGDVSLGYARKEVLVELAPPSLFPGPTFPTSPSKTNDFGLVARVTPLNTVDAAEPGSPGTSWGGMRIDLSFALSSRNHDDSEVQFPDGTADPIARDRRTGFGARFSTGFPLAWADHLDVNGNGWLVDALTPFTSAALTFERSSTSIPSAVSSVRVDCATENRFGVELAFANILTLRTGYIDAADADIQDWAFGFGLGFRLQDVLGFRYDFASTPQASGLETVGRQGVSVFIDGVALTERLRDGV